MNTTPLISIIIPVYNDERYIAGTIESCINQTFTNIEIVVVDDASTDKTPQTIKNYANNDKRIKIITHKQNKKTFAAINNGIMSASGKYVVVISGDDTFELNAMETFAKVIENNPEIDIVHYGRRVIAENGHVLKRHLVPKHAKLSNGAILNELFNPLGESMVNHQVRKRSLCVEIIERYFKVDKALILGEDQVMAFLYVLNAKTYVGIDDVLYNYYSYRGNDRTRKTTLTHFLEYRMRIIDSMNELQRCLNDTKVDGWVWDRFAALRRHHYAWAVYVTRELSKDEAHKALDAWHDHADAVETLLGVMTTTPQVLQQYVQFIGSYRKENPSIDMCKKIIHGIDNNYNEKLLEVRKRNEKLRKDMQSYLSIKRAAKLTLANVRRRITYGKLR